MIAVIVQIESLAYYLLTTTEYIFKVIKKNGRSVSM